MGYRFMFISKFTQNNLDNQNNICNTEYDATGSLNLSFHFVDAILNFLFLYELFAFSHI